MILLDKQSICDSKQGEMSHVTVTQQHMSFLLEQAIAAGFAEEGRRSS